MLNSLISELQLFALEKVKSISVNDQSQKRGGNILWQCVFVKLFRVLMSRMVGWESNLAWNKISPIQEVMPLCPEVSHYLLFFSFFSPLTNHRYEVTLIGVNCWCFCNFLAGKCFIISSVALWISGMPVITAECKGGAAVRLKTHRILLTWRLLCCVQVEVSDQWYPVLFLEMCVFLSVPSETFRNMLDCAKHCNSICYGQKKELISICFWNCNEYVFTSANCSMLSFLSHWSNLLLLLLLLIF